MKMFYSYDAKVNNETSQVLGGSEERSGTAFEYALAVSLEKTTSAKIASSPTIDRTKEKFSQLPSDKRSQITKCADRAAVYLLEVDSRLTSDTPMTIGFNSSRNAQVNHDVRDLIVESSAFTIGISCKVNNSDLRHSRLSGTADFVREWGLASSGASRIYWEGVKPVFYQLRQMSSKGLRWDDVYPGDSKLRNQKKMSGVVAPVLDCWEQELLLLIEKEQELAPRLTRYLLGSKSYWKVVARVPSSASARSSVSVQRFNLEGDMPGKLLAMPSKVLGCAIKIGSPARERIVTCDNDFTFGFRLHTAESEVIPSLKFAVKGRRFPSELDSVKLRI